MSDTLTSAFGLGRALEPKGFIARGPIREVWRLKTARGDFAAQTLFDAPLNVGRLNLLLDAL